jgi:acetyl esterase
MPELDPDMARLLQEAAATPAPDLLAMPVDAARDAFARRWRPWNTEDGATGPAGRSLHIEAAGRTLRALVFRPEDAGDTVIVYLHGGGWMFGAPETHAALTRRLAGAARATVVSLDYRLSPEHPFPAARDDALAAVAALRDGAVAGIAARRIALTGDSAGAAVALSAAQALRDAGGGVLSALALFYGCYAPDFATDSYRRFGDGAFGLSLARMERFWQAYAGDRPPEAVAPGLAPLEGLPPVYLNVAALDVLRDDSLRLAAALAGSGVAARMDVVPGVVHGYAQMVARLPVAGRALDGAAAWLADLPAAGR